MSSATCDQRQRCQATFFSSSVPFRVLTRVSLALAMADEVSKAQDAAPTGDTIFGKILRKEIPCKFIHDDEHVRSLPEVCFYGCFLVFVLISAIEDCGNMNSFAPVFLTWVNYSSSFQIFLAQLSCTKQGCTMNFRKL